MRQGEGCKSMGLSRGPKEVSGESGGILGVAVHLASQNGRTV